MSVPGRAKRWRVAERDPSAPALAAALRVPVLLAALLLRRGCTSAEDARQFLDARLDRLVDPRQMAGMPAATARLRAALQAREPILVCGDFDADGVSGTALLVRALRLAGGDVRYALPRRLEHGYGLPVAIVEQAAAARIGLLVAVDHGVGAHAAIGRAAELGLDVIVCDHHLPPAVLPPALAILNPRRSDCAYPFRDLCGAGIAFKLVQALLPDDPKALWPLLDLVAVATIADLVPLLGENRVLVRHGLPHLAAAARPGLRALAEVAGVPLPAIGPGHVAFGLAPRLNAAGRLDDARLAVELLLTEDAAEAVQLARELDRHNRERQGLEGAILESALREVECQHDLAQDRAIVLSSADWHPGVLGIVASRLVERFARPVALIAERGEGARGSARSAAGWHITDALARCGDLLSHFGGHRAAAGFSLAPQQIPAFRERFLALAGAELAAQDLVPVLSAEAEVALGELTLELAVALEALAPHGVGNPEPIFVTRNVQVVQRPRLVGRNHLKMRVRQTNSGTVIETIGFGLGAWLPVVTAAAPPRLDLAFVPERNVWNGRECLQLRLKDVKLTADPDFCPRQPEPAPA